MQESWVTKSAMNGESQAVCSLWSWECTHCTISSAWSVLIIWLRFRLSDFFCKINQKKHYFRTDLKPFHWLLDLFELKFIETQTKFATAKWSADTDASSNWGLNYYILHNQHLQCLTRSLESKVTCRKVYLKTVKLK